MLSDGSVRLTKIVGTTLCSTNCIFKKSPTTGVVGTSNVESWFDSSVPMIMELSPASPFVVSRLSPPEPPSGTGGETSEGRSLLVDGTSSN
jgi:hypothetical protein